MSKQILDRVIHYFLLLGYLVLLGIGSRYILEAPLTLSDPRTLLFFSAALVSTLFMLLLPALLLTRLAIYSLGREPVSGLRLALIYATALIATASAVILLFADHSVYTLYGFHLNGFVLNLVLTPGGIESMGGSTATVATIAGIVVLLFVLQGGLLWLCHYLIGRQGYDVLPRRFFRYALLAFGAALVTGQVSYAVSHLQAYTPVLISARCIPFYQPITLRHLAHHLGLETRRLPQVDMGGSHAVLDYPLHPLQVEPPAKPLNIVWLVAESWRWDMLDPEIAPATWAFARQATRFTHHYSGGNGTRMGLFSLFYGLPGNYWFPMLATRRGPVLMDVLQQEGYQFALYTSAHFSYPEFDQTLFVQLPADRLHEPGPGAGWERDRANVTQLVQFLERRDPNRPFMTFMFFESPHARYYFPPESIIRTPYLPDINYATLDLKRDIGLIKNRYINACHHLDSQFGRILSYLTEHALLDNTLVIMTGDHGEEFMEAGHWGHNSQFTDPQTHTPLILYVPGRVPAVVDKLTSHLDLPATLLPLLGVNNPPADYSLGLDLFGPVQHSYTLVSDWSRVGFIDSQYKLIFPIQASGLFETTVLTADDRPVTDIRAVFATHQAAIQELLQDTSRFLESPALAHHAKPSAVLF